MHIQFVGIALSVTEKFLRASTEEDRKKSIGEYIVPDKKDVYPNMFQQPISSYATLIKQSNNRQLEFGICRLYRTFDVYMRSIIGEMYQTNPMMVVQNLSLKSDDLKMPYNDIIECANKNSIEQRMIDHIFKKLQDLRSTKDLVARIIACIKFKDPAEKELLQTKLSDALIFLELRHLYIHNKGVFDKVYVKNYGSKTSFRCRNGAKIPATYEMYEQASMAIMNFCKIMDVALIKYKLIKVRQYRCE